MMAILPLEGVRFFIVLAKPSKSLWLLWELDVDFDTLAFFEGDDDGNKEVADIGGGGVGVLARDLLITIFKRGFGSGLTF